MEVAGYLGVASGTAKKICKAINTYGYAFIACSIIAACVSGGTLASLMAGADYICATVLSFYQRHLAAQAIVW